MTRQPEIKYAVAILLAATREAYGDTDATPASAYRWSVSPDGTRLQAMKSGLDWREFDISNKNPA
jgi:hypothetical protein